MFPYGPSLELWDEDRTAWWPLNPKEVASHVLTRGENLIVWSSPWPVSPNDTIEFHLSGHESRANVRFRCSATRHPTLEELESLASA